MMPQMMSLPPMMPKPGQGMDPIAAMMHGLGPTAATPGSALSGPLLGPEGLPFGGSLPVPMDGEMDDNMGGSDLLKALAGAMGGAPGGPGGGAQLQGLGTGDPQMGAEQLLQLLALGSSGVSGAPGGPGASGIDPASWATRE